jgi:CRP-like cAMP-binding protein
MISCVCFITCSLDENIKVNPFEKRQIPTCLLYLKAGQSILDADIIPGLYIIISGEMVLSYCGKYANTHNVPVVGKKHNHNASKVVTTGSIIGHVALLSGNSEEWYGRRNSKSLPMMTAIVSSEHCWLLKIGVNTFLRDLLNVPSVIFNISHRLIDALPPILRLFDFCIKWKNVECGDHVVTRGQPSTGELMVVLFGRLGVFSNDTTIPVAASSVSTMSNYQWSSPAPAPQTSDKSIDTLDTTDNFEEPNYVLSKGSLIGEVQLLTGGKFEHTVKAMRKTSLAIVPFSVLNYLTTEFPSILSYLARNVSVKQSFAAGFSENSNTSCRTSQSILMLPISASVPIDLVGSTLKHCLGQYVEKVSFFSSSDVASVFGCSLESLPESELFLTVASWLHEVEIGNDIVVYQADWNDSAWNRLISTMSDEIVLFANAFDEPEVCRLYSNIHLIFAISCHRSKKAFLSDVSVCRKL